MAVLVLFSSTGITYAQHFCGDFEMIATLTLGQEKLSCAMVAIDDDCATLDAENHSCCDNQYTKVLTDDNFSAAKDSIQLPANFWVAFVSVFFTPSEEIVGDRTTIFSEYNPPPLIKNIPVLFETFLI